MIRNLHERLLPHAALSALLLILGAPSARSESYIVQDLGTLGGTLGSAANAINNSGQVVGYAFTTDNAGLHATLFSGTGSNNTDLGGLAGAANDNGEAYGINDSGQIIGHATAPAGNVHATLFSGTGSNNTDLGTLGGTFSSGRAINNNTGQMVGVADAGQDHATRFSGTGSGNTDLGGVGGGAAGIAYANNKSGQIVGQATTAAQAGHATLFSGTGSGNLDLGTLGGFNSSAYGMNDGGQIVGSSALTGNSAFHAALFSGTGSNNIDLGTLGGTNSHAYAINNSGQIVGNSFTAGNAANHAFIYSGGTMSDLNDLVLSGSGVTNIRLQDNARVPGRCINDSGQIAATGDIGGRTHAILLTPGSPTPTPTATPTATPSQLLNISTRLRVQTGDNALIGGVIITGTDPKRVIIRGIGPSLAQFFTGSLADPTLELNQGGALLAMNDNWRTDQEAEIEATGIPPSNDLEGAIVRTLTPGAYTAILRGNGNTTGIGVVEAYDLDLAANSRLANISTRGFVETGDNVMIGGLIIGPADGASATIVVRAIGPSLTGSGVPDALQDPILELHDSNGNVTTNDNWRETQETEIQAAGLAPSDDRESAILATLVPGSYTAIVRGVNSATGNGLVEVYHLQ